MAKNLFDFFPNLTKQEVLKLFRKLTKKQQTKLIQTFGTSLDNKVVLSKEEKDEITEIINNKTKKYTKKNEISLTDDIINDTLNKLDYKELSKKKEIIWIKKLKLAFYDNVDDKTKEKYFDYYCEVNHRFKEKYDQASEKEKEVLLQEAIENARYWEDKFIKNNQRLIISILPKDNNNNLKDDLMQEANIGLIKALEKFELEYNTKFSTYAVWWIKQSINRYTVKNKRTIRVPEYVHKKEAELLRVTDELTEILRRQPTTSEIAKEMNLPEETILLFQSNLLYANNLTSLNVLIKDDEKDELENKIPDNNSEFSEIIDTKIYINQIIEAMNKIKINKTSKKIILMHSGINEEKNYTYQEIAEMMKTTRQTVEQAEKKALFKLKTYLINKEKEEKENTNPQKKLSL